MLAGEVEFHKSYHYTHLSLHGQLLQFSVYGCKLYMKLEYGVEVVGS